MGRRIEAPGGIWLVRLHGCADRLRHRVYISWSTPTLERETAERQDGEQTAQQCEGDSESGGLPLELGGHEGDHQTDDRRREPDRQQGPGEYRHPEATVQHRLAVALAESPDEGGPKDRLVLGGVAIVEDDPVAAGPAVQAGRIPRSSIDGGLEARPSLGGRAAAGERHGLHERSPPRSTVTACPASISRSPASRTRTTPPRGRGRCAVHSARWGRSHAEGPR